MHKGHNEKAAELEFFVLLPTAGRLCVDLCVLRGFCISIFEMASIHFFGFFLRFSFARLISVHVV
jgi:hypothetical protein